MLTQNMVAGKFPVAMSVKWRNISMQNRLKRICAFLCVFALLVTTVLGSSAMMLVKAADPQEPSPVTLDGFTNVTISDFVDASENPMEEKEYTNVAQSFYAKDISNFDKTLLSMKVKFNSGSTTNTIYLGGTGGYTGFNFRMQAGSGGWMLITNDNSNNAVVPYNFGGNRPVINASDAGDADFTSFLNNEFLLQFSFEFGTPDANQKADLKLGVYVNGQLYNGGPYTISGFDMTKVGNAMFVACGANESITLKSVVFEPEEEKDYITLDGFENITISDFVDAQGVQMPEGEYPGEAGEKLDNYHVDGITDFSDKLVSMRVKFYADGTSNRMHIGGTGGYTGFSIRTWGNGAKLLVRNDNGVTTTAGDAAWATIDASEELGVTSFLNNEFVLQMSFEYSEGANNTTDLTLGIYINGNACGTYTITGCAKSQVGSYLSLYRVGASTGFKVSSVEIESGEPEEPPVNPPEEKDYITLDGFENITISDFVDAQGVQMPEGEYPGAAGEKLDNYHVDGLTDFSDKLVSMRVKFYADGTSNRMHIGGTGGYTGFSIRTWGSGAKLLVRNDNGVTTTAGDAAWATIDASEELGVTSFLNNEFVLQMSFEYSEGANNTTDLTLGIYINGNACGTYTITGCAKSQVGSYLSLYRVGASTGFEVSSVEIESGEPDEPPVNPPEEKDYVTLDGFQTVIIDDFVDASSNQMPAGLYAGIAGVELMDDYSVSELNNFDKTLVSMRVKLHADGTGNRIHIGGTGKFTGFSIRSWGSGAKLLVRNDNGVTTTAGDAAWATIDASEELGVTSFLNNEFVLQMSFEYSEGANNTTDLTLGIYINGKACGSYTITGCAKSQVGSYIGLYRYGEDAGIAVGSIYDDQIPDIQCKPDEPDEPQRPDENFEKLTFAHFKIKDKTYPYNGDIVVQGVLKEKNSLDKTVLCGDIQLDGSGSFQLIFGGKDNGWDGLRLITSASGNAIHLYWYQGKTAQYITTYTSVGAGIGEDFIGEKFNLMLSAEIVGNDVKFGLWFNDVLYLNEYIIVSGCAEQLGNRFAAYCEKEGASVTLNSIPELAPPEQPPKQPNESFEKITFEYFGLKDGTYKCDGTSAATAQGKGAESLDKKVICGDILFSSKSENHLMVGGKDNLWYGLRFITKPNGTIQLWWVDEEGMPLIEIFDATTADATLVGEWLNIMISTEIIDADGDGAKDDIELGVWFNGVLYKEEFYTIIDKASLLGKQFGFDCPKENDFISIRSIPELVRGFDYAAFGLTKDWEKTLLNTGLKAEMAVGGSKDPEPFTGDLLKAGRICLYSTATIAAIVAGLYVILQRKKQS